MSRGLTRILACIWSAWAGFGLPCIIRLASGAGSGSFSYLCVCSTDHVLAAVRHDLVHSFVISGSGRRELFGWHGVLLCNFSRLCLNSPSRGWPSSVIRIVLES